MASAREGFVLIGSFPSVGEAELVRGQLAAAGISVRLDNAQTLGVLPMHALALGGVGVVVPAEAALRAREILGFHDEEGLPDEQTEPGSALALVEPDTWMRRAAVAAAFGSLLVPVLPTLYSIYVLLRHRGRMLSPRGRRHRAIAVGFNAVAIALVAVFVATC